MSKINLVKSQSAITMCGRISTHKRFELEIETDMDSFRFRFNLVKYRHYWNDLVCSFNLVLGKWSINFNVTDIRKGDEYTKELLTLEQITELLEKRDWKPKYKTRRRYEKWFFTSQFLK